MAIWADVGGGEADRAGRDHAECRDAAGLAAGQERDALPATQAAPSGGCGRRMSASLFGSMGRTMPGSKAAAPSAS